MSKRPDVVGKMYIGDFASLTGLRMRKYASANGQEIPLYYGERRIGTICLKNFLGIWEVRLRGDREKFSVKVK